MGRQVMDVSNNVLQLQKSIERVEQNLNERVDNITKVQESLQKQSTSQCDEVDEMFRYASRVRLYVGTASRRTARVDEYVRWRRATAWRPASESAAKHAHE